MATRKHLFELGFIISAVILVVLVGVVNCLQGTPFVNGLKCGYGYTSADLTVKAIAMVIFLLFTTLLLGPVALTLIQPNRAKRTKTQRTVE